MVDAEKKSSLRKMLSDAVPLLCRSSLGIYNSKLSVEAIICITVNNNDLVHISFNEILTAEGSTVSHAWCKRDAPNIESHTGEPERCKENSDASSSSDLGRLNKRSAADDETGGTTFDDRNLSYKAVEDASGVDLDQWNEIKPNDSWSDSTARKRRSRHSSKEKTLRQDRQANGFERRALDDSSHSKHDEVEATLPESQTSPPGLAAPDIKVEQLENEDCLFVKMETDINNDDYGFSTMADIAAFDPSFPVPVRKRLRTQTSFENCDASAKHSFARSTASKTYSHVAQRQSHIRPRSGNAAQEELNRQQGNHSLSLADYQVTQSTTSVVPYPNTVEDLCKNIVAQSNAVGLTYFVCPMCQAKLGSHQTLKAHIKGSHLDLNQFACNICYESFRWFMQLHRHRKKCHPDQFAHMDCGDTRTATVA